MSLPDRIRAAAALLDDDALAALANRGLVRRARRDLEAKPPTLVGEAGGRLELDVEGCRVAVDELAAASTCTCPAQGICRHILTALMFLAAQPPAAASSEAAAPAPTPPADAEVAGLTVEEIDRWAGAALARRARRELAAGLIVRPGAGGTGGPILLLALPDWGIDCRYFAGGGLAGMLCACHEPSPCIHRVAAILGHRVARGVDRPPEATESLEASTEAPRTRAEVCSGVRVACGQIVGMGLSRLSPSSVERLRTLATSAHGVDLPRLERVVRSLADEIDRWLGRGPTASDEELVARASLAATLARALGNPSPPAELVGQHRGRYERVHDLDLVGVGARAFRSASGYRGLTVHFWDCGARVWSSWTDARPDSMAGFNPVQRFTGPGPWSGCESPAVASASHLRLHGAWRSRARRISGRESTRMTALGPTTPAVLPAPITRWSELVTQARAALVTGLGEADEGAPLALIRPASWLPPSFDQVAQRLDRPVVDEVGRAIALSIPHGPETKDALADLETLAPAAGGLVFGRLGLQAGALVLAPIAVIDAGGARSFGLLSRRTGAAAASSGATAASEGDPGDEIADADDDAEAGPRGPDDAVARALGAAWAEVEAIAAAGVGAYRRWTALADGGGALHRLGLGRAAGVLDAVGAAAGTPGLSAAVLDAAWVLRLARAALAVEQAAQHLG
jgi:hypothetical protein